jgi:NAD(P)-dependent dehydrogenase (short-subunit alcohol dehydrogenase family)
MQFGPLFDAVESALGPVDILVNNAAHFENPDTVFEVSAGTFDRYFAVNSRAPALLMRDFALRHRARCMRWANHQHQHGCGADICDTDRLWGLEICIGSVDAQRCMRTRALRHNGQRDCARSRADGLHYARNGTRAVADHSVASPRYACRHCRCRGLVRE